MTTKNNNAAALKKLAREANANHKLALKSHGTLLLFAKQAGDNLWKAHKLVKKGRWQAWIEDNFVGSYSLARDYMRVSKEWNEISFLLKDHPTLSLSSALRSIGRGVVHLTPSYSTSLQKLDLILSVFKKYVPTSKLPKLLRDVLKVGLPVHLNFAFQNMLLIMEGLEFPNHTSKKLTKRLIIEIRKRKERGDTVVCIAKDAGVAPATVYNVLSGKSHKKYRQRIPSNYQKKESVLER